jgi:hypothetical protein
MKILLEVTFISNQRPALAGFPPVLHKCRVVKETVDVPVWIAQPIDWAGIPMEEL